MPRRRPHPLAALDRLLPGSRLDLLRQIGLFALAYYAYRIVRGLVNGQAAVAFANARDIVSLEQSLHLYTEGAVQSFAEHIHIVDLASWAYVNTHFVITMGALAWLYLRRNESFYFVRNMFMVAMGLALVGYLVYPLAPPRFLPELGFHDSVSAFTGVAPDAGSVELLLNRYAAMPSMHVGFACMLGFSLVRLVRSDAARVAWSIYPLVVTFVVLATGNHWLLDAVFGALTAGLSALTARALLARARPDVWRFAPAEMT